MFQKEDVLSFRGQRPLAGLDGPPDLRVPDAGQRLLAGLALTRASDPAALIEEADRLCRRALPISSFAVTQLGTPDSALAGPQKAVRLLIPGDCHPYGVLQVAPAYGHRFASADLALLAAVAELLGAGLARLGQAGTARRDGLDGIGADGAAPVLDGVDGVGGTQLRLRNDLQVLQGLADLQSTPSAGRADFGWRLAPLAALYGHLPGAGPEPRVDLGEYLRGLCARIEAAGSLAGRGVALVAELRRAPASLDAAASLGAIVNELVTAAAERAPKGGRILVRLAADDDGCATLLVAGDEAGPDSRAGDGPDALRYVRCLVERAGARIEQAGSASWRIDLT